MPADGGKLLFDTIEKEQFIKNEPKSEKWFKRLISAREHLNGRDRWCLWLEEASDEELLNLPKLQILINEVKKIRLNSSRPHLANAPHLFAQITQPKDKNLIIIPRVSSENRDYLPLDLLDGSINKVTDSFFMIATDKAYIFGVLISRMHLIWTSKVGGKMKTDIQYSKTLCYNTFPFPPIDVKQKENLSQYVFDILEARANHAGKTLAWMYDPDTMPGDLKQAHQALDKAVEQCYRLAPFDSDSERLEYLFKLYEKMIAEEKDKTKTKTQKTK